MKKILSNKINLMLTTLILAIILLMYLFPVLHDDLLHGSIGIGFNFMPHVNGRYLGNFFAIFLSSNLIFRVIIKSLVIILIILIIKKLLKIKDNTYLLLFIILFLLMPKEMFRETMPFTSGFANYIIPITSILFIIYIHLNNVYKKSNLLSIVLFLLIGVFNSLFIEHITLYNLILSIYLLFYNYKKNLNINYIYLAYFIGSLLGTLLMFTNQNYLTSFIGDDPYRSFSSFKEIFIKPWAILRAAFFHNHFLNLSLMLLISIIYKNKIVTKNIITKIMIIFIWLFGLYSIFKIFFENCSIFDNFTKSFEALITFIFFLCIGYILFISKLLKKQEVYRLSFYFVSMIIILMPLVMVSPLGPRCYIITYILMIVFILELLIIMDKNKLFNIKSITNIIFYATIFLMIFYINIYGKIYLVNNERIKTVKHNLIDNKEIIKLKQIPYSDYLHMSRICSEYGETVFRIYYNIPSNIIIKEDCN